MNNTQTWADLVQQWSERPQPPIRISDEARSRIRDQVERCLKGGGWLRPSLGHTAGLDRSMPHVVPGGVLVSPHVLARSPNVVVNPSLPADAMLLVGHGGYAQVFVGGDFIGGIAAVVDENGVWHLGFEAAGAPAPGGPGGSSPATLEPVGGERSVDPDDRDRLAGPGRVNHAATADVQPDVAGRVQYVAGLPLATRHVPTERGDRA